MMGRPLDESSALDSIHAVLDGREWSSEDLETVARIVEATGREVNPPREDD